MNQRFDELTGLARIYLDDGAPATAAKKLRQLADELEEHARQRQKEFDALIGRGA